MSRSASATQEWLASRLLERVPIAIAYVDRDLVYRYLNPETGRIVGVEPEDALGRPLGDVIGDDSEAFAAIVGVLESGQSFERVVAFTPPSRPDRTSYYLSVYLPDLDEQGRAKGVLLAGIDVSEAVGREVQVERRLEESERLLRALIDNSQAAIYAKDTESRFILNNAASARLLGSTPERILGQRDEAFMPREYAERIYENDREIVRTGERQEFEESLVVEGETRTYVSVKFPIYDDSGRVRGVAGISTDITERKRVEEDLRRSERRFRSTFDQAAIGIAHVATDGRWVRVNRKLADILGYEPEELMRLTFQNVTHPDDVGADEAQVHELLEGHKDAYAMDKRYFRKDGSVVWVRLNVSLVRSENGEPLYFVAVVEELTERKRLEEERDAALERARRQRGQLEAVLQSMTEGVIIGDTQANVVDMNPEAKRLHGLKDADRVRRNLESFPEFEVRTLDGRRLAPEEWPLGRLTRGERFSDWVLRVRNPDTGADRIWTYSGSPIYEDGTLVRTVLTVRDITETKSAEEERERLTRQLEQERAQLRAVLENMEEAVAIWNPDGEQVEVNEANVRMLGFASKDEMPHRLREFVGFTLCEPDGHTLTTDEWPASRVLRGESFADWELEVVVSTTGRRFIGSYSGAPVRDESGRVMLGVVTIHDVTEIYEAQLAGQRELLRTRILMEAADAAASLDPYALGEQVLQTLQRTIGVRAGALYLVDDASGILRNIGLCGYSDDVRPLFSVVPLDSTSVSGLSILRDEAIVFQYDELPPATRKRAELAGETGLEWVVVPVHAGDSTLGNLTLVFDADRTITPEDLDLFRTLTDQMGVALENAQLHARTEEELARTSLLEDVALAASTSSDLGSVAEAVLGALRQHLRLKGGDIRFVDGDRLRLAAELERSTQEELRDAPLGTDALLGARAVREERILTHEDDVLTPVRRRQIESQGIAEDRYVSVPALYRGRAIGVLTVAFEGRRPFDESEKSLLRSVAQAVGQAIENARLFEQQRRGSQLGAALADIDAAIHSSHDFGEVMARVVSLTASTLDARIVGYGRRDVERDRWVVEYAYGIPSELMGEFTDEQLPIAAAAYHSKAPVVIADAAADGRSNPGTFAAFGTRSVAAYPLLARDEGLGVLWVGFAQPHAFADAELDFMRRLTESVSLALQNARLFDREVRAREQLDRAVAELERTNTEATERASQLASVFASIADGVVIYDGEGRILIWNDQAARILGYTEEHLREPIIERLAMFDIAEERGRTVRPSEFPSVRALAGETTRGRVLRMSAPGRPSVWVSISAAPIEREGEYVGAVATLLDITTQHELLERQERLTREVADANSELSAIARVTDVAISTLELDALVQALLQRLADVMHADAAVLLLAEEDRLRSFGASGLEEEPREGFEVAIGEGFAGSIASTRRPRYAADAQENPAVLSPFVKRRGIRSMLGVPLTAGDELIGVLHVDWLEVHPQVARELELLQVVADRAGLAIRNAQLYAERQRAAELGRALNEIDAEINSTLEFDVIMQRVVERVAEVLGADAGAVFLSEDGGWRSRFGVRIPERLVGQWFERERVRYSMLAQQRPELVIMNNEVRADPNYRDLFLSEFNATGVLDVALKLGDDVVGDVAVYHTHPDKRFTREQADFLRNVGASLVLAIRNARLYEEERRVADTLQRALLRTPEEIEGLEFACLYRSATESAKVGGDFYDLFTLEDGRVGLVIGDVSGKGLAASTLTSLVRNTLRAYAYDVDSPAEIVARTNRVVFDAIPSDMFMTLILGLLDPSTGRMTYCNAGHPTGLLLRPDGTIGSLTPTAPLIGAFRDLDFAEEEATISPGDVLLLYTDGVIEARGDEGMFGERRLRDVALGLRTTGDPRGLPQGVFERLQEFTHGHASDDVAMLAVALDHPDALG